MMAFLRLIRFPNLLIMAATQYLVRWCVMDPILTLGEMPFHLSEGEFFLLVLSTVLIAAAGYAINDYFDTRIDRINKPDRVVVGNTISRRTAMTLHVVMNVLGLLAGAYVSYKAGALRLVIVQAVAVSALWFYSVDLKHRFLTGNLVIAAMAFMVPFIPALFELPAIDRVYGEARGDILLYINYVVIGYSVFAFMTNFVREVIKDMEDLEGDAAYGSRTIPITVGIPVARWLVIILILVMALLLARYGMMPRYQNGEFITPAYLLLAVQLPMIAIIVVMFKANSPAGYRLASKLMKYVMLGGILSMPVFGFTS